MAGQAEARDLIDVRQVAETLKCHVATVWRRVEAGELPAPIRIAGRTFWDRAEIDALIAGKLASRPVLGTVALDRGGALPARLVLGGRTYCDVAHLEALIDRKLSERLARRSRRALAATRRCGSHG